MAVVAALLPIGCTTDDPHTTVSDTLTRTDTPDSTATTGSAAFVVTADTAWQDTIRQQY